MSAPAPPPAPRAAGGGERPGFLIVRLEADGGYRGALMVTDASGLPLDFRFTDPISPTRLQRVLYGGVLDRHLRGEVIARTLLEATDQRPTLLLVDDRPLVDDPAIACPTALLAASAAGPLAQVGAVQGQGGDTFLLQVAPDANPLRVGLADGVEEAARAAMIDALVGLGGTMDLLEPLGRVREALEVIGAGEIPDEEA